MILYFFLDTSTSIILWIIKYLGLGFYYSISYLFWGNVSEEDEEKRKTLEMLIKQNEDIETIKKYIEELDKNKNKIKKE